MTLFRALSHKKNMFGLFLLFSSQRYLRLSWTFPCLFPFYLQKKALSRLLTISLGFFYRSRTKKAFCICLHLITLMLAYFTQTNVLVSLQLNWVPLSFISHNTKFILFCCAALDMNYGCSSFIAPEIVFACWELVDVWGTKTIQAMNNDFTHSYICNAVERWN